MMTIFKHFDWNLALLLFLPTLGWTAEPVTMFGLNHTALGASIISTNDGTLRITPGDEGEWESGTFGVSVELGEADSGIFGHLDTYNSLNWDGNFMIGHVYGQVNGESDQFLCSLGVVGVQSSYYEVTANFEALGAETVTYQVYLGATPVATETNATGPVRIFTWSEASPSANPFWRLPDGSIAAVVQLSAPREIRLPSWGIEGDPVEGDRIIIRAENPVGVVDFASRVDVTAGGGEDLIVITQERLGVFNHGHKALGDSLLEAIGGELTVRSLHPERSNEEMGVSIGLDNPRRFRVRLQPQDLTTNGASLVGSAVGTSDDRSGEFLGSAGVRNMNGALQAFGSFAFFAEGVQLSVYRNDCLVGTVQSPAANPTVNLVGTPRVIGFDAAADLGASHSWIGMRLDLVTTFMLPDGSALEGDQIRFRAASATLVDRLMAFNLTGSNLTALTINAESGPQTISLADCLPEVTVPAFLKKFTGANAGVPMGFSRSSARSVADGGEWVLLTDRYSESNSWSAAYSFEDDGLHFHGYARPSLELLGVTGLRILPGEITAGQSYFSAGNFTWRDMDSGLDYPVEVSSVTRVVGFESVNVPAGTFTTLRLETATTFSPSGASNAPTTHFSTNWLAAGVGVIKFDEGEVLQGGILRMRSGELTDFAILNTAARTHAANVGANVVLRTELVASPSALIAEWRRDGASLGGSPGERLVLTNLQSSHAGHYSVVILLGSDEAMTNEVARLRVIPFSDTPPFWVASLGSTSWRIEARATSVDNAGNAYIGGVFNGSLVFGACSLASRGGDDIFLAKIDPLGRIVWVRKAGGTYSDSVQALGVDASGNVYLVGVASTEALFGSINVPAGIFATKVDPDGTFLWVSSVGGTAHANAESVAVDSAGNLYFLGSFYNGTVTLGTTTLTNTTWNCDLFLTKLDANGQCLWTRHVDGEESIYAGTVAVDHSGSLYLSGSFYQDASFGEIVLSRAEYNRAGFLAKADSNGVFLWAQTLGTDARSIAVDRAGNAHVAGEFEGTASLGGMLLATGVANGTDAYLAKVSPTGAVLWARNSEHLPSYYNPPLTVDCADNVYLAGGFYDEATFGGTTYSKPSSSSTVLTKLDAGGQTLWHKQITGSADNYPCALTSDNAGNVCLAGNFRNQVIFGETNLASAVTENVFMVKVTGATAPTITQQPLSQVANLGDAVALSVIATGTEPLTYQWRKDGLNVPGAVGASYSIASVQWSDRGSYSVVVKNAGGIVASAAASLQVFAPDTGTLIFGETSYTLQETNTLVYITVLRTGSTSSVATVNFQTADGTANAGEDYWTTVASLRFAPGESLKTVAVPIVDNPIAEPSETVWVRLCNPGAGAVVGQPDTAAITILDDDPPGLPVIRGQPASRVVGVGAALTFSVVANGTPPLLYQWRKGGLDIPDATNRTFVILEAQFNDAGAYSVVVRNEAGVTASSVATLTVLPLPVILVQPQSQTVPYGERVALSVVATSSLPVVTQVFTRVSVGTGQDWYQLPGGGNGTLYIHYNLRDDPDTIDVYAGSYDLSDYLLGSLTTNGLGLFVVDYGSTPGKYLSVVVTPQAEMGGDGWSYRVEKTVSPLTYRWYGEEMLASAGPVLIDDFVSFNDAGDYFVVVSDAAGSVASTPAMLRVTGPLLRVHPLPGTNAPNALIQLQWNVWDYGLEACADLVEGGWRDVEGAYSGMILPLSGPQTFYRLRRIGD